MSEDSILSEQRKLIKAQEASIKGAKRMLSLKREDIDINKVNNLFNSISKSNKDLEALLNVVKEVDLENEVRHLKEELVKALDNVDEDKLSIIAHIHEIEQSENYLDYERIKHSLSFKDYYKVKEVMEQCKFTSSVENFYSLAEVNSSSNLILNFEKELIVSLLEKAYAIRGSELITTLTSPQFEDLKEFKAKYINIFNFKFGIRETTAVPLKSDRRESYLEIPKGFNYEEGIVFLLQFINDRLKHNPIYESENQIVYLKSVVKALKLDFNVDKLIVEEKELREFKI